MLKQTLICLALAASVATACYFLPWVNAIFGDYLPGFFIAAIILPFLIQAHQSHQVKMRSLSQHARAKRAAECSAWHKEDREATSCVTHTYDARNIDQVLHIHDGFNGK